MHITTITSRTLNQDTSGAKKAASKGPVIITDRGRPAHVLLTYAEYQRLQKEHRTIIDALYMPGGEDIDFDIPKLDWTVRDVDLS